MRATLLLFFMIALPSWGDTRLSAAEVLSFKRAAPCPSTGLKRGACPGYEVVHMIPLCLGGQDKRENMAWLSVEDNKIKTSIDVRHCREYRKIRDAPITP